MSDDLNPYDILGVNSNATKKQINAAYRERAKTAHPDHGGDPERFEELTKARDILVDDERRAEYDRTGLFTRGKEPDNIEAHALENLATILGSMISANIDLRVMTPIIDVNNEALKNLGLFAEAKRLNARQVRRAKRILRAWEAKDEKGAGYVEFITSMIKSVVEPPI